MAAFYDEKPSVLEAVGNGSYLYRWNIKEVVPELSEGSEETERQSQWSCYEAVIWPPVTSDKVITAVIRQTYTAEAEIALVNKFNAYQQGLDVDADVVQEYTDYLSFIANTKRMVKQDLGEETTPVQVANLTPRMSDIARVLALTVNTLALSVSDEDALQMKSIYPQWESLVGKAVKKDEKMQYDGRLWKVLQDHTVQEQYKPGTGTESLYTEVVESAAGTLEDPIPYNNNMELENGKYYSQGGVVYKCTRDTGQPVYNPLADLVGLYVEVAQ